MFIHFSVLTNFYKIFKTIGDYSESSYKPVCAKLLSQAAVCGKRLVAYRVFIQDQLTILKVIKVAAYRDNTFPLSHKHHNINSILFITSSP